MKKITTFMMVQISIGCLSFTASAESVKFTHDTIGCRSIGTFAMADSFYREGDSVAAQKMIRDQFYRKNCKPIKKGTEAYFYHLSTLTEGDYGSRTTVRLSGETDSWVVDKCALSGRDEELAKLPGYAPSDPVCENGMMVRENE